jgi:hypothetical protein
MIVTAWNPETDGLEKTYLSKVVQAGTNALTVKNADRIPQNSIILIGEMGMEQSEIAKIGPSGTSTTLPLQANLKFAHSADEPVYKLRYDKVIFYRSDTADGTYTLIETVDIDVDNRDLKTEYEDTAGTGTSFYKTKFYNSVTSEETAFSDYISAEGYGEQTIGSVIEAAVRRLKDSEYTVLTSQDYLDIATEVNHDISSQSERPYNFTRKSVVLDRVANQPYLQLPDDYFKFKSLEYTNVVGNYPRTKRLVPVSTDQFYTGYGAMAPSDMISRISLDDEEKRLLLKPTPRTGATGAFRVWYYRELGAFKNLTDEVLTPNTLIYRYKFMAEFYAAKAETDNSFGSLSTKYEQKYGNELMKLQRSNRKDVGTERSFMDSARNSSNVYTEGKRYVL